jgi:hypothetical protein
MSRPLERQIVSRARALIATPAKWSQGEFARDASEAPVSWRSQRAVRFCIWGALYRAAYELTGDRYRSVTLADHAASALRGKGTSLSGTNDRGRHADVLALMDKYLSAAGS